MAASVWCWLLSVASECFELFLKWETLLNIMKLGSIEYRKELMLVLLRITRVTGIRYPSSAQVFCNKYTDSNLEPGFRGAVMRTVQGNH